MKTYGARRVFVEECVFIAYIIRREDYKDRNKGKIGKNMLRFVIKRWLYNMEDLKALESRVNKLEFIFGQGAEDTVRKVQQEMLEDLLRLREALKEDLKETSAAPAADTEPLLEEIKKLREENAKLLYRIKHLKQHIE
jgi:hypothetical protein